MSFDVAGLYFPCSLVFYVDEVSIALNADNPVSQVSILNPIFQVVYS